jgi:hypothetical protein
VTVLVEGLLYEVAMRLFPMQLHPGRIVDCIQRICLLSLGVYPFVKVFSDDGYISLGMQMCCAVGARADTELQSTFML